MELWVILLIVALPVLFVLNDKYGWVDISSVTEPTPVVEKKAKIPSANKLMKFTKADLVDFAKNNDITVTPSKTKAEIVKQIKSK